MSRASVSWPALGTTATVVVTDERALVPVRRAVEDELAELDLACSRFRPDSDLSRVNAAAGFPVPVGPLLIDAIDVALRAARITDGAVDLTVGSAMCAIGYDRDIAEVAADGPAPPGVPAPGWRSVAVERARGTVCVPAGTALDLGATAKAWCADRAAARAAAAASGAGVLVNLGGDVALAGPPPAAGWPVAIADDHAAACGATTIALERGGLATSSTTVRRWRRGGAAVHHIVDPATGLPAPEVWRTVSVAAATCVDANTAATAAIVRGASAPSWLDELRLPARLVTADGATVTVGGWPAEAVAA